MQKKLEIIAYGKYLDLAINQKNINFDESKIITLGNDLEFNYFVESILNKFQNIYLDDPVYIKILIAWSNSKLMSTRDSATQLLGESHILRDEVIKILNFRLRDRSWVVRCSAMYALSKLKAVECTMQIIERYKSSFYVEREWVLRSLGVMKDKRAFGFLEKNFKRSKLMSVKYLSASSLALLGRPEYANFLINQVSKEKDPENLFFLQDAISLLIENSIV